INFSKRIFMFPRSFDSVTNIICIITGRVFYFNPVEIRDVKGFKFRRSIYKRKKIFEMKGCIKKIR
ncbi:MAG TPA: hypothetical protein DEG69_05110, partial [Flavobacteriaceae bacterium]|nr:hypothetical protein [Flavobacteriaceae bacterium]